MISDDKEVYFNEFCDTCEYMEESEFDSDSPCYNCLCVPYNQDTHKPINWKEVKDKKRSHKNPPVK